MNNQPQKIAILGAGAWGTALGIHLAKQGHQVCLWSHSKVTAERLMKSRQNHRYLKGVIFPESLEVTANFNQAIGGADAILVVVPSHVFRETLIALPSNLAALKVRLAWATKGFEPNTAKLLHQVAEEVYPGMPTTVLSGPTFADEVARGLPTAMVSASSDIDHANYWSKLFQSERFRLYTQQDMIGVEVGGAYKNIMAIATGLSDGLKLGANARAALITRGLVEMKRFAEALGAKPDTLMGLAGMGDLVLTCTDNLSRNRRFGLLLAHPDKGVDEAISDIGQVVEGVKATLAVAILAKKLALDLPIMAQVDAILEGKIQPAEAVARLMARNPLSEN